MNDVVVAVSGDEKAAMLAFLHARGARLHASADFQAIGRVRDGELIAVVAYNGFCGRVCSMHVAGDGNWINRALLKKAFDYPFRQLDLTAILTPIAADNERALAFDKHIGFEEVHRVRNGWERGVDLIILELRRSNCRHFTVMDVDAREALEEVAA